MMPMRMPNTWITDFSFREQTLYPQLCYVVYWLNSISMGNTFVADFKQLLSSKRFGYRIVKARWSGKSAGQYSITIKVVGNDDLGIVNNITSIISKEEKIVMRSINIDSHDGLFDGTIVVQLEDVSKLEALMKKLRTVKGVKHVSRL